MVLASFKTPIDEYCARVSECYSLGPVDVFQCVKDVRQAAHCFYYSDIYRSEPDPEKIHRWVNR